MKKEEFAEIFGEINENYIIDAQRKAKGKKPIGMKWSIIAACLCIMIVTIKTIMPVWKHSDTGANDTVVAPMITVMGKNYFAHDMPVDKLPATYHYLRDLTVEEANNTELTGSAIYVDPQDENMYTIYLYQECGTPIDSNTVDNTKRQWAYVKWTASDTE